MLQKTQKVWGLEETIVNNNYYCAKLLHLNKGYRSSLHYHHTKDETFFILEGTIKLEINGNEHTMPKESQVRIYPHQTHWFTALTENATILEISTHEASGDVTKIDNPRALTKDELSYHERLYSKPIEEL